MKYLKTYENKINALRAGDYVYCICDEHPKLNYFLADNIGQFINFNTMESRNTVKYENIPQQYKKFFYHKKNCSYRYFKDEEIKYFAKTKEELIIKINSGKFGL